ncbi:hypothetical protein [Halorubrum sp. AJ67]|uniref:hypothetical protein n=1 Tax=Halorubrum sp. AJ67 TaxID=1173487 RepID=UPI0003DD794F|nr:hypothetical protein [Halorubrum sp. AJ67]CDK38078.1 hypothetical protein BN903_278 [Halorubrum sp. AJ67]
MEAKEKEEVGVRTRVQTEDRVEGILEPALFESQIDSETDLYWGLPAEFFTVERGSVYLDAKVADELTWLVTSHIGSTLEITALPQKFVVDGTGYTVNPGFWASTIDESEIR